MSQLSAAFFRCVHKRAFAFLHKMSKSVCTVFNSWNDCYLTPAQQLLSSSSVKVMRRLIQTQKSICVYCCCKTNLLMLISPCLLLQRSRWPWVRLKPFRYRVPQQKISRKQLAATFLAPVVHTKPGRFLWFIANGFAMQAIRPWSHNYPRS